MSVGIVGSGPAVAAVESALADVDAATERVDVPDLGTVDLAVVAGQAGDAVFERANETVRDSGPPWIAVELGGIGGFPVVDAAVAAFGPGTACYECLSGRVSANLDPQTDPAAAPPAYTARFAGAVAGREAARHLRDDADVFGRVVEIPRTEREVLPLPNCVCAADRDRSLDRTHVERDLEESLARAERAVDDRVGLVQEVGEAESFPVPYYLSQGCDTTGFSDASAMRQAAGVDAGWDAAYMKALGEAMERYCAGVYRDGAFETALPGDLDSVVAPSAFVCPEEPDLGEPIDWVSGENLVTGGSVHLPAELVYYPPPEERFRPATTTGLGLGNSTVEALLAGLTEVVERDAAMLSWYSTFDPLELSVDDEVVETLTARARSEGLDVTLLLLTQDVDVPVVAAAVHREEWPRFALGSGAGLAVDGAARSALAEALQNWVELRGMGPDGAAEAGGAIGEYADLPPAAEAFIDTESIIPADSLGADEPPTGEEALEELLDRLGEADMTAYAVRTTARDVAALGFEAVRVLVPSAQPLFLGEAYFGERAESAPEDLGFEPRLDRDHHPFP